MLTVAVEEDARARRLSPCSTSTCARPRTRAIALYKSLGYRALGHATGLCRGSAASAWRGYYYCKTLDAGLTTGVATAADRARRLTRDPLPGDRPEGRPMRAPARRARWTTRRCSTTDPADQARAFAAAGFDWLHVVDLNGAFAGRPVNARRGRGDPGGGRPAGAARRRHPRHGRRSRRWLAAGVARVILGTAALKNPAWCARPAARFPAGSPSASTRATARSRPKAGPRRPTSTALRARAAPLRTPAWPRIIYTDIDRDGAARRARTSTPTAALARGVDDPGDRLGRRLRVSHDDRARLKAHEAGGIAGADHRGRALYDGAHRSLKSALAHRCARALTRC